jgi:DNA-binding NarL/FixJ family response regulator
MSVRFLIVDDSELVRNGLRTIVEANSGWEVCGEAADGLSGIEMFKSLQPDIVVLDFQMPGISGLETARRMTAISAAIPIIMFTQHASAELELHAREAGVRAVVSKTNAFAMIGIVEKLIHPQEVGESTNAPRSHGTAE